MKNMMDETFNPETDAFFHGRSLNRLGRERLLKVVESCERHLTAPVTNMGCPWRVTFYQYYAIRDYCMARLNVEDK